MWGKRIKSKPREFFENHLLTALSSTAQLLFIKSPKAEEESGAETVKPAVMRL